MKKLTDTSLGGYAAAISATVRPVRTIFEICGTILFAIPFIVAFALTRAAPLYLYLLYPLLFLVSHFVWFRLPSVDPRLRWILFWGTLTLVLALGAAFMYWSYREAQARGSAFPVAGIFALSHWVAPSIDADFPTAAVYFLVPSGVGAIAYCLVLALFLRIYRQHRAEEHRRRSPPDGRRA
jgi:hypothetical protein